MKKTNNFKDFADFHNSVEVGDLVKHNDWTAVVVRKYQFKQEIKIFYTNVSWNKRSVLKFSTRTQIYNLKSVKLL